MEESHISQRQEKCDVLVVGLGPAGAFALREASKHVDVIGIDSKERIDYPVKCGELLPKINELKDLLPETDRKLIEYLFKVPKRFISNETSKIRFISPKNNSIEIKFKNIILNRNKWIEDIVKQGEKNGARILLNTMAIGLKENVLKVKKEGEIFNIKAKVIIGADGAYSKVAKWTNLYTRNDSLCKVKQHLLEGVESETVDMYFGRRIAPGTYAYIIPKGNSLANVGTGVRNSFIEKGDTLSKILDRFIKNNPLLRDARIKNTIGAILPVGQPLPKTCSDSVMLVGDAARQVISIVGAGIPPSAIAGSIAGEISARHILEDIPLSLYEKKWKANLSKVFERSIFLRKFWDKLAMDDDLIEKFMGRMNEHDGESILRVKLSPRIKITNKLFPLIKNLI
ncbi:MAG: geranylgeranyl reductase family protein [Candidatus Hydrothermarchaeota archaeon]